MTELDLLIEQLENYKKSANEYVEIFSKANMETSKLCSEAMAMAYQLSINAAKMIKQQ